MLEVISAIAHFSVVKIEKYSTNQCWYLGYGAR